MHTNELPDTGMYGSSLFVLNPDNMKVGPLILTKAS